MNRLESLDWLRGLLAVSIMVYHLTGWTLYHPQSNDLLGRLGIYGVSMFFILSGLAMAAGYANYICNAPTAAKFFVRRIFRIWPLLWLAVAAVVVGGVVIKGETIDWVLVLLNLTTAFGFVSPGAYINTGAWSIGNEMVYYALTPPLLMIYNYSLRAGNAVFTFTVAAAAGFAFWALSAAETLASQWALYINPFNNLFLFTAGVALYYNTRTWAPQPKSVLLLLITSTAFFVFYPAEGDLIVLVTGTNRFVFCTASVLIVLAFYKLTSQPPRWISAPLSALGAATYGVYLLHPIVFPALSLVAKRLGLPLSPLEAAAATVAVTIAVALLVYRHFELPLIRIGKRLTELDRQVAPTSAAKCQPKP